MKLSFKPRQNAIKLFNYMHSKIDFEELEANGDMPLYFSAMDYFAKMLGNDNYVEIYDADIEILLKLKNKSLNTLELAEQLNSTQESIRVRTYKLVTKGYIYSYLEKKPTHKNKKLTYYSLTPYGLNKLRELVEQREA